MELAVSEAQGSDFVASGDEGAKSVTILAGETEAAFSVATVDDGADEPDGSVTATLAAGPGYTVSATANAATVAVADNDAAAGGVTVSIADAREQEGWRRMTFALSLSEPVAGVVIVKYRTRESSPRSAEDGKDYSGTQGVTLFLANRTSTEAYVYLRDDAHDEGEETFEVEITSVDSRAPGVAVTIADGVGVGTIVNNDPIPAGVAGAVWTNGVGADVGGGGAAAAQQWPGGIEGGGCWIRDEGREWRTWNR